ncbi:MAG: hypothetical protein KF773_16450 [Deltaproteobacteria bacterium]|nr:hypothetical protein [Deltaproteobacteria bacterium]
MKPSTGWRNISIFLLLVCAWQAWRGCHRPAAIPPTPAACAQARATEAASSATRSAPSPAAASPPGADAPVPATDGNGGLDVYGFKIPAWALWFAPHQGEDLRAYRDRVLPIAQSAIAPHRTRVARSREDFAKAAGLDEHQRAELEAATRETAAALQERVFGAVLGGELAPGTFKPMTGVAMARELIELVDKGHRRFTSALREDQRSSLAKHPFDFGDYLVFSTKWEEVLAFLD